MKVDLNRIVGQTHWKGKIWAGISGDKYARQNNASPQRYPNSSGFNVVSFFVRIFQILIRLPTLNEDYPSGPNPNYTESLKNQAPLLAWVMGYTTMEEGLETQSFALKMKIKYHKPMNMGDL